MSDSDPTIRTVEGLPWFSCLEKPFLNWAVLHDHMFMVGSTTRKMKQMRFIMNVIHWNSTLGYLLKLFRYVCHCLGAVLRNTLDSTGRPLSPSFRVCQLWAYLHNHCPSSISKSHRSQTIMGNPASLSALMIGHFYGTGWLQLLEII